MRDKLFTEISSGSLKGKKLRLPSLETTRSTKSIVKGSFFDSIRFSLRGAVFIEGFGGSGVMAAEAYSNGALCCYAIERDNDVYKVLASNFASISPMLFAVPGDCFRELYYLLVNTKEPVILYLDPPFDIRAGFSDVYDQVIILIDNLKGTNIKLIAIEHASDVEFAPNLGEFTLAKSKKFGKTTLSYYERSKNPA